MSRWGAVCLLVVVSVLAACGDPGPTEAQTPRSVEAADDLVAELFDNPAGTSFTMGAGLGDDLAVMRVDGARLSTAAYRTPVGDWGELPVPPVLGTYDLAGVRDTVMLGGYECRNDDCSRFLPRFLVLEDDRRSWREVPSDFPEIRVDPSGDESEAVFSRAAPQVMDYGVFTLRLTDYLVDPDTGPVELNYDGDPALTNPNWARCRTDDAEILVPLNGQQADTIGSDEPWRLDGVVLARDLHDVAAGFQQIAAAPQIDVDTWVCGYRTLFLYRGATEHQFDLDTLRWTSRPSSYMQIISPFTDSQGSSQLALPDGTTWDLSLERSPDGTWSTVPPATGRLVVTGSGVVYGIGADGVTTYRDTR